MASEFANLNPYAQQAIAQTAAAQAALDAAQVNPIENLIKGYQQGVAIRNLPQTLEQNALSKQLALDIQRANLAKLQQPQIINTSGGALIADPTAPGGYTIIPGTSPVSRSSTSTGARGTPKIYVSTATGVPQYKYFVPGTEPEDFQAYIRPVTTKSSGSAQESAGSEFTEERTQRNLDSVKDLKADVTSATVGAGSLLSAIPGTAAADFQANVDTLKANIAFNELQAMRNASKTGGALGSIAVKELELLQSALGSLNTRQSKKSFLKNLDKIEKSISRFENAKQPTPDGATNSPADAPAPTTSAPLPILKISPRKSP